MYLFILETIGTQELILVGIIALIVFGPRKLPEMARKAGSMIRELRTVSNDFKSTWSQEVRQAEEGELDPSIPQEKRIIASESSPTVELDNADVVDPKILPQVREVSKEDFDKLVESKAKVVKTEADKENWL